MGAKMEAGTAGLYHIMQKNARVSRRTSSQVRRLHLQHIINMTGSFEPLRFV